MEARAISHLEITTYIGCPVRCSYCPQEVLLKNYKGEMVMSLETFKKILKNVPSDVDIHFSGFSEPFCHKEIVKFLKEAFKKHQVVVYTTTIGINKEIIEQIKDMPFKDFFIHQVNGTIELPFGEKIWINEANKISRGGNLWKVKRKGKECMKSANFSQNVVLPNGDVYICCMDYGLKHKIGNLLEQNFKELKRKPYEICKSCEFYY